MGSDNHPLSRTCSCLANQCCERPATRLACKNCSSAPNERRGLERWGCTSFLPKGRAPFCGPCRIEGSVGLKGRVRGDGPQPVRFVGGQNLRAFRLGEDAFGPRGLPLARHRGLHHHHGQMKTQEKDKKKTQDGCAPPPGNSPRMPARPCSYCAILCLLLLPAAFRRRRYHRARLHHPKSPPDLPTPSRQYCR